MANEITTDLIDLNPQKNIIILNFSLEMIGFRQVGRTLSSKLRKTTSTLYSSEKNLDDDTFKKVISVSNQLKEYPIYFIDIPTTPMQVKDIIFSFYNEYVKGKNADLIIIYDHALLTKQIGSTIDTISELSEYLYRQKNYR